MPNRLRIALMICALMTTAAAAMGDGLDINFKPGCFSDFCLDDKGGISLFPMIGSSHTYPILRYSDSEWKPTPASLTGLLTVCNAIQTESGKRLLLTHVKTNAFISEWTGKTLVPAYHLTDNFKHNLGASCIYSPLFKRPYLLDLQDGVLGLIASDRYVHTLDSATTSRYEIAQSDISANGLRPSITYFRTKKNGVLFWRFPNYNKWQDKQKQPFGDFHIYHHKQWRSLHYAGGSAIAVAETDNGKIYCSTPSRQLFTVSLKNGATADLNWPFPSSGPCIALYKFGKNNLLAVTARSIKNASKKPENRGLKGSLIAVIDGKPRLLLNGIDLRWGSRAERSIISIPTGTLVSTHDAGLIYVSNDTKTVRRIDWRHGLPMSNIDRMELVGNNLLMLDYRLGFVSVPWQQLIAAKPHPSTKNWKTAYAAFPQAISSDGKVWSINHKASGTLLCTSGTNTTEYKIPGNIRSNYVRCDTRDRVWLISNVRPCAVFENGKWQTFKHLRDAYATFAAIEKNSLSYQIGKPDQHMAPAFTKDGRIAYRDHWYINYYDGTNWHRTATRDIDKFITDEPFFYHGVLTITQRKNVYQLIDGDWKKVGPDVVPKKNKRYWPDIPPSFPEKKQAVISNIKDNTGCRWINNRTELYRGNGDIWQAFPTQYSPLEHFQKIISVMEDSSGSFHFTLQRKGLSCPQYLQAQYIPPTPQPKLNWATPPPDKIDTDAIKMSVLTDSSNGLRTVRACFDNHDWLMSKSGSNPIIFSCKALRNGKHTVRIQAFDELLRSPPELSHTFTVERNYTKETNRFLPKLASDNYAEREAAARSIINIGPTALEPLAEFGKERPDLAWWTKAISQRIKAKHTQ